MNASQIAASGNPLPWVNGWVLTFLFFATLLAMLILCASISECRKKGAVACFCGTVLAWLLFIGYAYAYVETKPNLIKSWQQNAASPYIASLPFTLLEAKEVQIGRFDQNSGKHWVRVSLPGRGTTVELKAELETALGASAVLRFKDVPEKLGPGFEAGMYEARLAIPRVGFDQIGRFSEGKEKRDISRDSRTSATIAFMLHFLIAGLLVFVIGRGELKDVFSPPRTEEPPPEELPVLSPAKPAKEENSPVELSVSKKRVVRG